MLQGVTVQEWVVARDVQIITQRQMCQTVNRLNQLLANQHLQLPNIQLPILNKTDVL